MINTNLEAIKLAKMKIFDYVIGNILKTIKAGALMGAFIQSFCLIDYLSAIARLANNNSNKDNYKKFIEKYLSEYDSEKLYVIRCGLIHTYGQAERMKEAKLDGYVFQHKNPENHRKYEENNYWLNLSNFVFDIIKAAFYFFNELEQKQDLELYNYKERVKDIILVSGPSGIIVASNFGNMDSILSCLDSEKIDWKILENEIYKLCLTK